MLIGIRHATTDSNVGGGKTERLRGWTPIPLNKKGMKEAQDIAETIDSLKTKVKSINSGAHPRHVQTAHEIATALGLTINPMDEFNDLNTGIYAGREVTPKLIEELLEYYREPSRKIPEGETVNNWVSRVLGQATPLVESPDNHILIVSGRTVNLMLGAAKTKGGWPDEKTLQARPLIDNGDMFIINPNWDVVYQDDKGKAQAS